MSNHWPQAGEEFVDEEGDYFERPPINQTLMELAWIWSERSSCPRRSVGCVAATASGHVLSSGYNGAPAGMPHCTEAGCLIEEGHCVRALHAEPNLIINAGRFGVSLKGSRVFITLQPCLRCTMMLIAAGVSEIVFQDFYQSNNEQAIILACHQAGVRIWPYKERSLNDTELSDSCGNGPAGWEAYDKPSRIR